MTNGTLKGFVHPETGEPLCANETGDLWASG